MELFGIVLSVPVAFIASVVYCFLLGEDRHSYRTSQTDDVGGICWSLDSIGGRMGAGVDMGDDPKSRDHRPGVLSGASRDFCFGNASTGKRSRLEQDVRHISLVLGCASLHGPGVIVSPDELNAHLRTVIVAPMTTSGRAYTWRIRCRFQNRSGFVVLDQLRTVDRERLVKRLGALTAPTLTEVLGGLHEMFAE